MRAPRSKAERVTGLQLTGQHVESRWWYWVAAIPPVFGFWIITVVWVAIAIALEPGLFGNGGPVIRSLSVSLVAMGVPFIVLTLLFPVAVFRDASDIAASPSEWNPPATLYGLVATAGLLPLVVLAVATLGSGPAVNPTLALVAGFVLNVPFSLYYLKERHERVGVP